MYQKLRDVTLKTGEAAELGVIVGPDNTTFAIELRALLGHKGPDWKWQIEQSLSGNYGATESRFYILSKGGLPFANIMTVESRGIGIFGHVYTLETERRKGAADIIQSVQLQDFKQRGGRALFLGTEFDSPPFHLYSRHGFKGSEPECGCMTWFAKSRDEFEREIFAPAKVRHEPLSFAHWPTLPALSMMKHPARARIVGMDVLGALTTEGGSLQYLIAMDSNTQVRNNKRHEGAQAFVGVSENSEVPVAIAALAPDHHFFEQAMIVDLFAAPGFEDQLPALFGKLAIPAGRGLISYADLEWPAKQDALRACGFTCATRLKRHLRSAGQIYDVELWAKGA